MTIYIYASNHRCQLYFPLSNWPKKIFYKNCYSFCWMWFSKLLAHIHLSKDYLILWIWFRNVGNIYLPSRNLRYAIYRGVGVWFLAYSFAVTSHEERLYASIPFLIWATKEEDTGFILFWAKRKEKGNIWLWTLAGRSQHFRNRFNCASTAAQGFMLRSQIFWISWFCPIWSVTWKSSKKSELFLAIILPRVAL